MIEARYRRRFRRPLFIVSSPRAGSSLLFLTLAKARNVFTVGGESHGLIESLPGLHPFARGWTSNRLAAEDATPALAEALARQFYNSLRDRDGRPPTGPVTMIEKTPKNSLRIPFLRAIFPDARFLYLHRDPRETLSSMLEAWNSGRFVTYPRLPDWPGTPWSLLLTPNWRALAGRPLPRIVAHQWAQTADILLADLAALPPENVRALSYADLLAAPQQTVAAVCAAFDLDWDQHLCADLPLSPTVITAPALDKWRRDEAVIAELSPIVAEADARAQAALAAWRV